MSPCPFPLRTSAASARALAQLLLLVICVAIAPVPVASDAAAQSRIKDLVDFEGVRGNSLIGFGLVVGLDGSGDSLRTSPPTETALVGMLERLGVSVDGKTLGAKNVAAVMVTATLPPFARKGSRIDINVAAVGDAKSLHGGTLILTPLAGVDGKIYALAQGSVLAGGVKAKGEAAEETTGVPTSGTVPGGAFIEKEIPFDYKKQTSIKLALRDADFTTARRIEEAINLAMGRPIAMMLDGGTVKVKAGPKIARSPAHLVSRIENLPVKPAMKARVVIDQRSGTIVLGADVRISPVAVAQGNLTIRVTERPTVSQPSPFSETGSTVKVPSTDIDVDQAATKRMAVVPANTTLADLVDGLNALGVGPRGMIDILKSIKAAGALHAELVIH
ncbi:MAG: flagellar basal body P-ring protein FlgI [Neomegalonema sp.]|nr:flagellar basal body P-ring protein FlgI [Neomegalonema sp.]